MPETQDARTFLPYSYLSIESDKAILHHKTIVI